MLFDPAVEDDRTVIFHHLHNRIVKRARIVLLTAAGVGVMAGESLGSGVAAAVLPLVMSAAFAGGVVIVRHRRHVSMLPATCLSQAIVVVAVAPFVSTANAGGEDWAILAALGVGQMGLSLALFTVGARLIAPAEVALIALLEVVLSPLWVWLAYGERPAVATLIGGCVVLAAVVVQATAPTTPRWRGEPAGPFDPIDLESAAVAVEGTAPG